MKDPMVLKVSFCIDVARLSPIANEELFTAVNKAVETLLVSNIVGKKLPDAAAILGGPFAFEAEDAD
jgi:hypothetical protein